ncbi:MAG: VWA domain-containing protein [Acidobacteria bacterium]|nr:VWA domain-containing protein [Acidobacteriota bacterium]
MRSLLLTTLCATFAFAQQPPADQPPPTGQPFRIQVNEVIVPVTVTDEKGKFVNDLEKKDFKIYDEGKEQTIRFFTRERSQPVVVGFLVDQSNASRMHWSKYQDAISELVLTLLPNDKRFSGYLVGFSQDAELLVNTTSDPEKLLDKIRKMKPGGGAALFDSIYMACTRRDLVKGEPIEPRRVIVILADGHDNASKHTMEQVIELAQRQLVTIYCVSTVGFGFSTENDKNLERLAQETGGRVVYPLQGNYNDISGYLSRPSDEGNYAIQVGTGGYAAAIATGIFKAVTDVAGEVTTQYLIRYIPSVESDAKPRDFRRIEVKVALANVKVRARKGYYPATP